MLGGISIWQLLIVLGIVILIFGTKKLRTLGSDLGGAVKGFKKAVDDEKNAAPEKLEKQEADATFDQKAEKSTADAAEKKDKA